MTVGADPAHGPVALDPGHQRGTAGLRRHDLLEALGSLVAPGTDPAPATVAELRHLTRDLLEVSRPAAREEYLRFLAVRRRGLTLDRAALRAQLAGATVVVTGGTGCIGSVLVEELRAFAPARIVSLSRGITMPDRWADGVEHRFVDLRNATGVRAVLDEVRPRIVYHLAAQHDPGRAEQDPHETIGSNVFGTRNLLEGAAAAGVETVVHASTGKALRPYTPDVYAASKKLGEWLVARAASTTELALAGVRFTHVVDNSIIFERLRRWTAADEPVRLHGTDIHFYLQSALESAHLVLDAGLTARPGRFTVHAIRDLGEPASLTDLALGAIDRQGGAGALWVCGFESGYEETPYPCLYDPIAAGDLSPLISSLESPDTTTSATCAQVDEFPFAVTPNDRVRAGLEHLEHLCTAWGNDEVLRRTVRDIGWDLLDARLAATPDATVARAALRATRDRSPAGQLPVHARTHEAIIRHAAGRHRPPVAGADPR